MLSSELQRFMNYRADIEKSLAPMQKTLLLSLPRTVIIHY